MEEPMSRRTLSQTSFYDPEVVQPDCLQAGTVPWLLARFRSRLFPNWLFRGWRGEGRWGRDAWPAVTLLTLLFLRWSEEGISRLGSTKRAKTDVCWRAAMGLHMQTQVPDEKTLREFEAFLHKRHPDYGIQRFLLLHEHIIRWCLSEGVVGDNPVWTMDSSPMWCYGAVMDTVRLIGDGTRMLAMRWAKATGQKLHMIAEQWGLPYLLAKSIKGYFGIDWSDADERAAVLETLVSGALHATEQVRCNIRHARSNRRKRLLRHCKHLVYVIAQDLDTDEQGRLAIAKKVARDRIVSLTDPSARHGRKSKSKPFNGFKFHVLGDIVSGLIAAVTVTAANVHDGSVAHRLIRRAKYLHDDIEHVLGDTAYGGATLRHRVETDFDVKLVAPPVSPRLRSDKLTREDFKIDFVAQTATCPAGVTTDDHVRLWSTDYNTEASTYRWPIDKCKDCPLRPRCCAHPCDRRKSLRLHPHEQNLRQARADWNDPQIRKMYRQRSQFERLVNQMVRHGARRARAWGIRSAQLQAHLIAMRCNLQLLARALAQIDLIKAA
jgi:hypothetical protein